MVKLSVPRHLATKFRHNTKSAPHPPVSKHKNLNGRKTEGTETKNHRWEKRAFFSVLSVFLLFNFKPLG
jgi:hypothetical protein